MRPVVAVQQAWIHCSIKEQGSSFIVTVRGIMHRLRLDFVNLVLFVYDCLPTQLGIRPTKVPRRRDLLSPEIGRKTMCLVPKEVLI